MLVPRALATALGAASFSSLAFAQDLYKDEDSGIEFVSWTQGVGAEYTFGIVVPESALETDADEYIGRLRCSSSAAGKKGWCGFSHGQSGQMTQSLLLVVWPHEDQVLTSFRYADGYSMPMEYAGNATLTQISSKVDDTGYEIIYRCQGCFAWDHNGITGGVSTSGGFLVGGRAQGSEVPQNSGCPKDITFGFHDDGFGQWGVPLDGGAANPSYDEWAALATKTVAGCGSEPAEPPAETEPAETKPATEPTTTEEPVKEEPTPTEAPEETGGEGESKSSSPSRPSRQARQRRPPPGDDGFGFPSWPDDPWDDDDEDDSWGDFWDDFWDGFWDDEDEDEDEDSPSSRRSSTRRLSLPPRPTPTRTRTRTRSEPPKASETSQTLEPEEPSETSEPEESPRTSRPLRPTPTFWPEPWVPSTTSEQDEPSETSEPEGPEDTSEAGAPSATSTPEVDLEIGVPTKATETEKTTETEAPEEPTETESTEEPSETESTEEPSETDTPEAPVETEVPDVPEGLECTAVGEDDTFDYVVIGAGAGGIPVADRLSEAGHKVLLIEKGVRSTARWGGKLKPEWLEGEALTRFDVPGLCNQIWHDSTGIVCTDMDQIAGCVLGGGTAVNAGLWWKPHPLDWDDNFPAGWKNDDVAAATRRVFSRIPGTTVPSRDGILYQREGYDVLEKGLNEAGWKYLDNPNASNDQKNRTFGHTTFMFSNAERGGPLATYLVTASRRENFSLWTDTSVRRLIREGSRVTGVELQCAAASGHSGTIKLAENGRVVVSAGTFGSAKLLMRSGIGPADQLKIVADSALDGESFIADSDWIELPVGENLMDHLNTDVVVEHPDVFQYNYTEAWWDPIEADKKMYLEDRSGILAAAAPNIGPMIWDDITVSDGTTRQLQWTSRMEGSLDFFGNHTITMSQYLGRGVVSRGRMAITPALTTRVATLPYLRGDKGDREALIQGLENIRAALADVPNLKFLSPADNVTSEQYVDNMIVSVSRRSNHWLGTNKIGEDDGREGGSAVVDSNTKVYGTDNLFVVDGSIMPGMMTGNPSAMIVIIAEHAADKILALKNTATGEAPPAEEPPAEEPPAEEPPAKGPVRSEPPVADKGDE